MSWGSEESQDSNGNDHNASASVDSQCNSFALGIEGTPRGLLCPPGLRSPVSQVRWGNEK